MSVTRNGRMPTHALAAFPSAADPSVPSIPLVLPIDARIYQEGFRLDINIPDASPGWTPPAPHTVGDSLVVTLPVIPVTVPDPTSLSLILLFGMGLETQSNYLAWRLLPSQVIQEFPNAATMSVILARARGEQFDRIFNFNQGVWRNCLALGLKETKLVELVQMAWNVTAEAKRIRQRNAANAANTPR